MSKYGYLGKPDTLVFEMRNQAEIIMRRVEETRMKLLGCMFMNHDFRDVFKKISIKKEDKKDVFVYADPPYLDTTNTYEGGKFTTEDSMDLFDILEGCGMKFAMSEFDHPFIIEEAKKRELNVVKIGERNNLKNRRLEILVTNYKEEKVLF